jgi:PAS domain S-box-containing protein
MTNDSLILHKELIENLPVGIVSLNHNDLIVYMSESAKKMLCVNNEKGLTKEFNEFLLPEYKQTHLERLYNYTKGELQPVKEYIMKRTNGSLFWAEVYALPRFFNDGEVFVVNVVFKDITERKLGFLKLQESETRLSALIESTNDIIWSVDKDDFRIMTFNSALKKYLHDMYGTEISIGSTMEQLLPAINAEKIIIQYKKVLSEGEFIYKFKTDNSGQYFSMSFNLIKHNDDIIGISVFGKNITEYLQARMMLQNEMEFNKTLLQSLPVLFIVIDNKREIKIINQVFKNILGYSDDEIINKEFTNFILIEDDNAFIEPYVDELKRGISVKYEYNLIKKNGETALIEWYISPIIDSKGKIDYVMAAGNDITERRKNETELSNYRQKLEDLVKQRTLKLEHVNKLLNDEIQRQKVVEEKVTEALKKEKELNILKSRFVSIASHEFRTPLTTIYSSAQLLERYGKTWDNNLYKNQFNRIKENINHLTGMLDDILIIGKTETDNLTSMPSELNLKQLCDDIIADIKLMLSEKHYLITSIELSKETYFIDEKAIKHILLNLLSNAIKYSPNGGKIGVSVCSKTNSIEIIISDEGIGIPEEDRASIFESFHRARNIGDIRGTGLGLAITKKFVDVINGTIEFSSEIQKGTIFQVNLPINN